MIGGWIRCRCTHFCGPVRRLLAFIMKTMTGQACDLPIFALPTNEQASESVNQARRMFARTLSCWASDVLTLRRCGTHHMTWDGASSLFSATQVRKAA
jgi:hypothetical protein